MLYVQRAERTGGFAAPTPYYVCDVIWRAPRRFCRVMPEQRNLHCYNSFDVERVERLQMIEKSAVKKQRRKKCRIYLR